MLNAELRTVKGGSWLVEETPPDGVFTRERLSDEQRMIGQTAEEFVDKEVLPALDRLEQKDWALARTLVTLVHALRQRHKKIGIVSLCLGGGEAVAMAVEAM